MSKPVTGPLTSIGLMSGTSLDGIDIALLQTDGAKIVHRGQSRTYAYTDVQRNLLRETLRAATSMSNRNDRNGILGEAEEKLTDWHAEAVHKFLKETSLSNSKVDIIGFHGQTILHRPEHQLTVQLGSGQALANATGIKVAFDMRAADVAAGGQGAPLVPVYHQALAANLPHKPVAFVNIGGVANVTFVNDDALIAFDTGPGNALIDDWVMKHHGTAFDHGGALALSGKVNASAMAQFLGDTYFELPGPKSLTATRSHQSISTICHLPMALQHSSPSQLTPLPNHVAIFRTPQSNGSSAAVVARTLPSCKPCARSSPMSKQRNSSV